MDFLNRLTEYMKENNLKQKDIIEKAEISKSYLSMVIKGDRQPNNKLLAALSKMNGKSINWWLNGKEEYDNLYSLNTLLDFFIKEDYIKKDGSMNKECNDMIQEMLKREIAVKLEKAQH